MLNMFRTTMCPSSGAYAPAYHATNSSMDALPANRSWQPSRKHGTYQHEAITSRSRQLLMMGTWLSETCWATIRREIKNKNSWQPSRSHGTYQHEAITSRSWWWAHGCPKHVEQLLEEKWRIQKVTTSWFFLSTHLILSETHLRRFHKCLFDWMKALIWLLRRKSGSYSAINRIYERQFLLLFRSAPVQPCSVIP